MHDQHPIHPTLVHPLTGEPLRAVGLRKNGTPIWPIMGGSEAAGEPAGGEPAGTDSGDTGGDAELGDAGKKALAEERDNRKAAEKRAKAAEAELEKVRTAGLSEAEKKIAEARKEGATEAVQAANGRLINSEARALAAEFKFRDTRDVVVQLRDDLGGIKVNDDGEVDDKALRALVEKLAKDKPYLVDDGKSVTAPASAAGIGAAGSNTRPDPGPGLSRMRSAYEQSSSK